MNGRRESDSPKVSSKPSNNGCGVLHPAERLERRGLAKGNLVGQNRVRTQGRIALRYALSLVRRAARRERRGQLTALWHHVYRVDQLRETYFSLKHQTAPGIDGQTWEEYGKNLGANLGGLSERLKRGGYRAKPVRRVYIPKSGGRQRAIGIPVLEDKIVQRVVVEVLNAIYEAEFNGFSYGFRPKRSQHNALDALRLSDEGDGERENRRHSTFSVLRTYVAQREGGSLRFGVKDGQQVEKEAARDQT